MEHIKLFDGSSAEDVQQKMDKWTSSQKKEEFCIILVGPFVLSAAFNGFVVEKVYTVSVVYDDSPEDVYEDDDEENKSYKPRPHKK